MTPLKSTQNAPNKSHEKMEKNDKNCSQGMPLAVPGCRFHLAYLYIKLNLYTTALQKWLKPIGSI